MRSLRCHVARASSWLVCHAHHPAACESCGYDRRTGPLREGRFRSCPVSSDRYLLTLYRYIDLNPVRSAVVASAEEYPWSSARANLGLVIGSFLTPQETYLALHEDGAARGRAYREWLDEDLDEDEASRIRAHTSGQLANGKPNGTGTLTRCRIGRRPDTSSIRCRALSAKRRAGFYPVYSETCKTANSP